ncbi:hypothetical protein FI667_g2809, partial [Globisporangium splendens]
MPKKPRVKQVPIQGSLTYLGVPKPAEADKARQDLVNCLTKAFRICEVLEKHVDKCPDKLKKKRAKKALIRIAQGIIDASDGIGECFRRALRDPPVSSTATGKAKLRPSQVPPPKFD